MRPLLYLFSVVALAVTCCFLLCIEAKVQIRQEVSSSFSYKNVGETTYVYSAEVDPLVRLGARLLGVNTDLVGAEGGGIRCVACTAVVGLVEQLSVIHNKSVVDTMDMMCSYLPDVMQPPCQLLIEQYGAIVIAYLESEASPDQTCNALTLCTLPTCNLFPPASADKLEAANNALLHNTEAIIKFKASREEKRQARMAKFNSENSENSRKGEPGFDPWQWLVDEITKIVNSHRPILDLDNDGFSTMETLRGSFWRGRDCDDYADDIYPGRSQSNYDAAIDHNCNGIKGRDPAGRSYEELFCSGTKQYGVIVLGDSAGAHFHVPPDIFNSTAMTENTFKNLVEILTMEFDWPEMSSGTGFTNMSWVGTPGGPVKSSYLYMRERNLCMHRDYQNICLNGARSSAMASHIMQTMSRNQTTDQPAMLTYALIGNDVCNGHHTMDTMTTPQEFYKNVVTALNYLDTTLPRGSHVIFIGLVDGRILFEAMADRIHPIGSLRHDVTYRKFYDYMNCLHISPCFGWMNSNATWRNATTQRAFELNQVYKEIIANHTYKNFDMTYFDPPLQPVLNQWRKQGGHAWQLIEPVDGFHPNQMANALFAEYQWKLYLKQFPDLVDAINPNNVAIQRIFGNQGGH